MKRTLTKTALLMALALSVSEPATMARDQKDKKAKPSAEHVAALKKCNEDYHTALKEAKSKKGKERKGAEAAAKQSRKQCVADAPM